MDICHEAPSKCRALYQLSLMLPICLVKYLRVLNTEFQYLLKGIPDRNVRVMETYQFHLNLHRNLQDWVLISSALS